MPIAMPLKRLRARSHSTTAVVLPDPSSAEHKANRRGTRHRKIIESSDDEELEEVVPSPFDVPDVTPAEVGPSVRTRKHRKIIQSSSEDEEGEESSCLDHTLITTPLLKNDGSHDPDQTLVTTVSSLPRKGLPTDVIAVLSPTSIAECKNSQIGKLHGAPIKNHATHEGGCSDEDTDDFNDGDEPEEEIDLSEYTIEVGQEPGHQEQYSTGERIWKVSQFPFIGLDEVRPSAQCPGPQPLLPEFARLRRRLLFIYTARQTEARQQQDLEFAQRVMTPGMASILSHIQPSQFLDLVMRNMNHYTKLLLDQETITWESLLEIPAPTDSVLSQRGIYLDAVEATQKGVYVGSGGSQFGCGSRLMQYNNDRRKVEMGQTIHRDSHHLRFALQPKAKMHVRLLVTLPSQTTPNGLLLLIEGLLIDFGQTITEGHRHEKFHNDMMAASHRASVPGDLRRPQWIGLNHTSPLIQGIRSERRRQLKKQGFSCVVCGRYKPDDRLVRWQHTTIPQLSGPGMMCGACGTNWYESIESGLLRISDSGSVDEWYCNRQGDRPVEQRIDARLRSLPWLELHDFHCPVCTEQEERFDSINNSWKRFRWRALPTPLSSKIDPGVLVYCYDCAEAHARYPGGATAETFDSWFEHRRKYTVGRRALSEWLAQGNNNCVACGGEGNPLTQWARFFDQGYCCGTCRNRQVAVQLKIEDSESFVQTRRAARAIQVAKDQGTETKQGWLRERDWRCPVDNRQFLNQLSAFHPNKAHEYICTPCQTHWRKAEKKKVDSNTWTQDRRDRFWIED